MSELFIPNLANVTPEQCIGCNAVRVKIGCGAGELACKLEAEAVLIEEEWADYIEKCPLGPKIEGECGEMRQVCRHPDSDSGVRCWEPSH